MTFIGKRIPVRIVGPVVVCYWTFLFQFTNRTTPLKEGYYYEYNFQHWIHLHFRFSV